MVVDNIAFLPLTARDVVPATIHGKGTLVHLGVCRFNGCDASASTTVGIVPLCALHQSYIFELMARGPEHDSAITNDAWTLTTIGELET